MRFRSAAELQFMFDKAYWKKLKWEVNDYNKFARKEKRLPAAKEWEELHRMAIRKAHRHVVEKTRLARHFSPDELGELDFRYWEILLIKYPSPTVRRSAETRRKLEDPRRMRYAYEREKWTAERPCINVSTKNTIFDSPGT